MSLYLTSLVLFMVVLLSGLVVVALPNKQKNFIRLLLAFSGAYLLSLSFLHFLPEIYQSSGARVGLFVLLGFLIQLILEVVSGGIEHGHIHIHQKEGAKPVPPYAVIFGLGIHSFLEGMPLASGEIHAGAFTNMPLLLGIVLHKIPIAIVLMSLLLQTGLKMQKAFLWLLIFALIAPLGVLAGYFINSNFAHEAHHFSDDVLGVVVGIFLHVSTTILFEADAGHKFNRVKFITIILGFALAVLNM